MAILVALIISGNHYLKKRKGFKKAWPFMLFHTKHGVRLINAVARISPRFWRWFSSFGIVIGFIAMVFIFIALMKSTIAIFTTPEAAVGAIPVIPGVTIPFWFGVIGLVVVLVFHEFSHGIIARAENIKVKSVGLAFLGFIPIGAFVEPDDKKLKRSKLLPQLRMYVAGSFMNFIIAGLALLLLTFAIIPGLATFVPATHIVEVDAGGPAELAGLQKGAILQSLDGQLIRSMDDFARVTKDLKPGQSISMNTDQGAFPIQLGDKSGRGYIGIQAIVCAENIVNPLCFQAHPWVPAKALWFVVGAFQWIFILNLGIGLFNLLPLKPFDGGLMAEAVAKKVTPSMSKIIVRGLSAISLIMVIINLAGPYIF